MSEMEAFGNIFAMTQPIDSNSPTIPHSTPPTPTDSPLLGRICTRLVREDIHLARRMIEDMEEFFKKED